MGKLDTIYKLFKSMTSIDELNGEVDGIAFKNNKNYFSLNGTFHVEIENKKANVNFKTSTNTEVLETEYSYEGNLNFEDFMGNDEKMKKPSVTQLLKFFGNLKIENDGDEKILRASLDKILKEAKKSYVKPNELKNNLVESPVENIKIIADAVCKEFIETNYENSSVIATVNKDYKITKVELKGSEPDSFSLTLNLNF